MSFGGQSLLNHTQIIERKDSTGTLVENEWVDLPIDRAKIVNTRNGHSAFKYKVREGDTWSNIAARFYRGRSDLWKVIADWSSVDDPFRQLTVGQNLTIPSYDIVMFEVLRFDDEVKGRDLDRSAE